MTPLTRDDLIIALGQIDDIVVAEILNTGATAVASPFTWQRCAFDTLAAYRRALGQGAAEQPAREAGDVSGRSRACEYSSTARR